MDIAFNWAYKGEYPHNNPNDPLFKTAYDLFANPLAVPQGSTVYGMVLRPRGAGVFNWGQYV